MTEGAWRLVGVASCAVALSWSVMGRADDAVDDVGEDPAEPLVIETVRESEPSLTWSYRRFGAAEYILGAAAIAASYGVIAIPTEPRWTSTNAVDDAVSSALRAPSGRGRFIARDVSDVVLTALWNQLIVDATLVAWWGHGSADTALQMGLIDLTALGINHLITNIAKSAAGRERPFGANECRGVVENLLEDCRGDFRYRSFYSGHASSAFTSASLLCMHHAHLPLYGGGAGDVMACVGGMAAATTVASMRVVADRHYVTDVVVGAAMGALTGTLVPYALAYHAPVDHEKSTGSATTIRVVPMPTGGALWGTF